MQFSAETFSQLGGIQVAGDGRIGLEFGAEITLLHIPNPMRGVLNTRPYGSYLTGGSTLEDLYAL